MNTKLKILSITLLSSLLAGCPTDESPFAPDSTSTGTSSSNIIAASNFSIGATAADTAVFTLSGPAAINAATDSNEGALTASCADLDSIDGTKKATIVITAGDNNNAKVSSGTIYFSAQWGQLSSPQCQLEDGTCSVEWSAQTNIDNLASTSDFECFDGNTGTVDLQDSITAWTYGAESFTDNNGDNILSVGESYINVEEPYLDRNDDNSFNNNDNVIDVLILNGTHDTGDTDYNGPNCDAINRTDCAGAGLIPIFAKISLSLY